MSISYIYCMYGRWEISFDFNHNLKMEQVVGIPSVFFLYPVQRSFKQQYILYGLKLKTIFPFVIALLWMQNKGIVKILQIHFHDFASLVLSCRSFFVAKITLILNIRLLFHAVYQLHLFTSNFKPFSYLLLQFTAILGV